MAIFAESQDNPGRKILNKLKLMDISRWGIAPNWVAVKQLTENQSY